MNRTLSRPEKIAWARLARTPRIGPVTFHQLLARYRTPAAALDNLPGLAKLAPPRVERIEQELDTLEAMGARPITSCEPDYPPLLKALDAPAPVIAARGDVRLLAKPTIAMVGAREGSAAALMLADRIAAELGEAGFTIVSGLACDVDAAAHKGAFATGISPTRRKI